MANIDGDVLCITQEPNGEGNNASTNDDGYNITRQDVDLGLTLPPSDLSFDASGFFDGDAFQQDWLSYIQEGESQEDPSSQGPGVHSLFDEYQPVESPRKKQKPANEEHPLPTQEDETPSTNIIQLQKPSAAQEAEPHPSPTDSGYGISIATSWENVDDVNNTPSENRNDHLSGLSAAQFAGNVPLQNSGTAEHLPRFDINNTQPLNEDDSLIVDDPEDSPSSNSESSQPRDHTTGRPAIGRPGVRMPKGFRKKKLSKKELLEKGMSAGWFGNKVSSQNPTPQDAKATPTIPQSIVDLPIPIAIAAALAPEAMRPAILETVFRIQSHQVHDLKRSSQPPAADPHFLQLLEKLFSRYEKEENLRNTLIIFITAKLAKLAEGSCEGEFKQNINILSMDSTTFTEDLAKMEKAINDISSPLTQQSIFDAIIMAFHVMRRNAAHIRELVAGQPYTASLEAKNKALSKQVERLAATCNVLQEQKQYRELTARGSKTINPSIPASIRMPPEPPSPHTPFAHLPVDFIPDPNKIYRAGFPHSNTAWMCLLTTTDTVKRCEAVNRTWSKVNENGFTLWTSRLRCVRCQQEHKSPANKYFLHESEVRQLGGLTRANRSKGDLTKPAPRSWDNANPSPVSVATLPPASQCMTSFPQGPGSIPLPKSTFAGTIVTPSQQMRFQPTPTTNNNSAPQPTNLPVQPLVQAAQRPAAPNAQVWSASSPSHGNASYPGQTPHKIPRKYVDINHPLTAHIGGPKLSAYLDPTTTFNDTLESVVPIVPRNEAERAILEGHWRTSGMPSSIGVRPVTASTDRGIYSPPPAYGVAQTLMYSGNPPHHRQIYSRAPIPAPIDMPISYIPQAAGSAPVRRNSQAAPQHRERSVQHDNVYITASTSNATFTGLHPAIIRAPIPPSSSNVLHNRKRSIPHDDVYVTASTCNPTFSGLHPGICGTPVPPSSDNVLHHRKRSTPDDEVIITGSTTANINSPTTSYCSSSESSSQDSNPNKKRCRKLSTSNAPREHLRRMSATGTPIPKNTGETLRFCLPGIERSWMKVGGHPNQPIAVDEDPAPEPVARKKSRAGLPKSPAEPKARIPAVAAVPETPVGSISVDSDPVDTVPVEKAPVEMPGVEELVPTPVPSIENPAPVAEEAANDDDDMGSLFGAGDNDEPEKAREMSDEVAEEWGAELEAMMDVTPDVEEPRLL